MHRVIIFGLLATSLFTTSFTLSAHNKVVVVPLGDEKVASIADDGVIDDSEASDNLSINNGLLNALSGGSIVDVNGQVTERATYTADGVTSAYTVSKERYIVESSSTTVGVVQQLDHTIVTRLCQDLDGCDITIGMVNWSPSEPGNVASLQFRLFYSQTEQSGSYWWRTTDTANNTHFEGKDGDGSLEQLTVYDCFLVDAETSTNSSNGRLDNNPGFGLLNAAGGSYSDVSVTCRVIIED